MVESPISAHWYDLGVFNSLDSTQYTALAFILASLVPCFPQKSVSRRGVLALQIYCTVLTFVAPPPSGIDNTAVVYTAGVLCGNLLARYLDRLYVRIPEREFFRLADEEPTSQLSASTKGRDAINPSDGEDASKLPPASKFLWMVELLGVTRGIGWNWRVTGIPRNPANLSRRNFLQTCALKYVGMYLGLYFISLSCDRILSSFRALQDYPELQAALIYSTSRPLFLYTFIVLGWALTIYSHFAILMLPLAMVCVGLGVGPKAWQNAEAWPPNFGSFADAYSIRRFWGYTWHQQMRRMASAPGVYLLSLAPRWVQQSRARASRLFRRYFLLLGTFLVSGLIHAAGSYNLTRANHLPISDGGEIKYFLLQGAAIVVEDLLMWVLSANGATPSADSSQSLTMTQLVGFAYTATFYVFTRVRFKCVPLTVSHGIHDERGDLFAAVEVVRRGAVAVPGNFVRSAFEHWSIRGF